MTPFSLTCPALTGGAFPAIPTMSHIITATPRERHLNPKTAGARNTCCRGAAWLYRGDIARPWVQCRYVSRPGPRRARNGAPPDHEGGQAEDPVWPHDDHGRRPDGARRLTERALNHGGRRRYAADIWMIDNPLSAAARKRTGSSSPPLAAAIIRLAISLRTSGSSPS
jgi:hypothetical protein